MPTIHLISIFILWIPIAVANFTCYTCEYSIENSQEPWNHPECMNTPWVLKGVGDRRECLEKNFCNLQATYDVRTGQVKEFSRKCYVVSFKTECVKDTYNIICTKSCRGDFCNRNDTADTLLYNTASDVTCVSTASFCINVAIILYFLNIMLPLF